MVVSRRDSITLLAGAQAPTEARRFFRGFACRQSPESCDTAELLISELVTNALRHGAPPITLTVDCTDDRLLRACVRDQGAELPEHSHEIDLWNESGRGVQLVDALSTEWGVETEPNGKVVWFSLEDHAHSDV